MSDKSGPTARPSKMLPHRHQREGWKAPLPVVQENVQRPVRAKTKKGKTAKRKGKR